jgi:ribosomal protein S18 acetylase RimI-like enzyme
MFTVRPAQLSDADAIAEIQVRTWQAAYAGTMPADLLAGLDVGEFAARNRRWIEGRTPPGEILVAEVVEAATPGPPAGDPPGPGAMQPVVVGFSMLGSYRDTDGTRDERAGEVFAIYVSPAHWSTGAGYALMRASVGHLAAHGCTEARLWVLADNPRARRFYERFGFVADGETKTETMSADGAAPAAVDEVRYTLHVR